MNHQPTSLQPDTHLLQAARTGDVAAFTVLLQSLQQRLYAMALQRTRCVMDAEDVLQQTLVKAWLALSSFREEASFSTWITRILFNEVKQLQRRGHYRKLDFPPSLLVAEAAALTTGRVPYSRTPEDALAEEDALASLHQAVDKLPPHLRIVLQLSLKNELSCEQIAQQSQLSLATVKSRLHRGRKELLKRLVAWRVRRGNTIVPRPSSNVPEHRNRCKVPKKTTRVQEALHV